MLETSSVSDCWYCHWGWSVPVAAIYREALAELGGDMMPLHYGPAHIVWEDDNFRDEDVKWCLNELIFNRARYDYSDEQITVVRRSLEALLEIPETIRCCEPAGYDGARPERFPPLVAMTPKEEIRLWR